MQTFLTQSSGALPADLGNIPATDQGQFAKAAVDRSTRALLIKDVTNGVAPSNLTFTEASKTLASAGTPGALAASGTAREVFIYPLRTNTADVYWGTVATNDTQHGTLPVVITAPAGKIIDLSAIYIDVTVNGEGVRYIANN